VQVWRGVKGHYHYPRSSKYITAPCRPSPCYSDTAPLLWYANVAGAVVTEKVTCPTLMVLGWGYYWLEAEKPAVGLVTANSYCERGCNGACMPHLTIYYRTMKM